MTTTALTPLQNFEAKLRDKIRDDIGALLPDEALAALVQRAVEEDLFRDRPGTKRDSWGRVEEDVPSPFKQAVRAAVDEAVKAEATRQLVAMKDVIETKVRELTEQSLVDLMLRSMAGSLNAIFQKKLDGFSVEFVHMLRARGVNIPD